jgi:hypothetical protein
MFYETPGLNKKLESTLDYPGKLWEGCAQGIKQHG